MVNVLIKSWLEPEHVERIRAVDASVGVTYDPGLIPPPQGRRRLLYRPDALPAEQPGWQRTPEQEADWRELLSEAEVVLDIHMENLSALPQAAPRLRWFQAGAAGAGEAVAGTGLLEAGVTVTTGSGLFSAPLAEFTVGAVLAHLKEFGRLERQRRERDWHTAPTGSLDEKTVCVVGTGSIGEAVAARLAPFGCRLVGVRRSAPHAGEHGPFDEMYATADLAKAVADADYVVITLPATPGTRHLFDARLLKAMKPGAYIVNVGRGAVIDEAALVEALRSGHISGAALDVNEVEPLPKASPLWDMPEILLGYHATAMTTGGAANRRLTRLFCDNLRRYLDGRPLLNRVDPAHLY